MAQMRVMVAGILIQESLESGEYSLANNYSGLEIAQDVDYKISIDSEFSDKLSRFGKVYTADSFKQEFKDFPEYKMLSTLKPSLIVPLILKNHINGILIF